MNPVGSGWAGLAIRQTPVMIIPAPPRALVVSNSIARRFESAVWVANPSGLMGPIV